MAIPGFKVLANMVAAPTGQPVTIVNPDGLAVIITKLVMMTIWPSPQQSRYHPVHKAQTSRWVEFYKGGLPWTGYSAKGAGVFRNTQGSYPSPVPVVLLTQRDEREGYRHFVAKEPGTFGHIGAYSMFSLGVNNTVITPVLDAPDTGEVLEMKGPITLAAGQMLQITNGIVHTVLGSYARDLYPYTDSTPHKATVETLANDYRARASHLRVIAYGQEVS